MSEQARIPGNQLTPAQVPSPGEALRRELRARGWTQKELAHILAKPPQAVSEIVTGKKQITSETALRLAAAFDTSPDVWINLESSYRLFLARQQADPAQLAAVARRREQVERGHRTSA